VSRLDRRVDLVVSNFRAWLPMLTHLPGARFEERDGVTLWTSDTRLPLFNGVWGAPRDSDRIDAILDRFERRPFLWLVPPPDEIDDELTRRGLQVSRLPGMALDLAALPSMIVPGGVVVSAVDHDDELMQAATTIAFTSNGFPEDAVSPILQMLGRIEKRGRFQTFLATVDGEPAAASAILVTGEAAGLFNVGTAPTFRRRGLGALVSLAALEAGRSHGSRAGVLESSAEGESLYRSLGFEEVCRITFATWPA
jgi:ribosomal protein S18 acetylase RimI-like enzyme